MLNIGERIEKIAEFAGKCRTMADIGADHGYLAIHMIQSGRAEHVTAVDINVKPAQRAIDNIQKYGLTENIEVRVGDGLQPLGDDIPDTVVIAGIGGIVTSDILDDKPDFVRKVKKLVLQPSNREDILRKYLMDHGFEITAEEVIKEKDRLFVLMTAVPLEQLTAKQLSILKKRCGESIKYEILFGKYIPKSDTEYAKEYLCRKYKYIKEALGEMSHTERDLDVKRIEYEEALRWLEGECGIAVYGK